MAMSAADLGDPPSDVVALVNTLTSTEQRRQAQEVCEVSKLFLDRRVTELVHRHQSSRVLTRVISSDATPLLLNKNFSAMVAGARRIVRQGKDCVDLMCERAVYHGFDRTGAPMQAMLVIDPTPLSRGKRGWDLIALQMRLAPLPRRLGATGPVLHHYVWDHGCCSTLDRLTRQHHMYEQSMNSSPHSEAFFEGSTMPRLFMLWVLRG